MPRVSACVSVLNQASLLKNTLESIQNQTFKDWECIVVDDGSAVSMKFVVDLMKELKEYDTKFTEDDDGITLRWGGCDYFIDWHRLRTKNDILKWICHFGSKIWRDMTPSNISAFIHVVYRKRGWDMYEDGML